MNILFVCQGNIFRSAVAEAFANTLLGGQIYAESAGTNARTGRGPHERAVELMRAQYGIDMSSHHPRQVDTLPLDMFDWIVAIDPMVAADLQARFPRIAGRILAWDIPDPGRSDEATPEQIVALIRTQVLALPVDKKGQ